MADPEEAGYALTVATLVLEPHMPEIEALKERRRISGIDRLDEVWEGVLHMVPAPHGRHAKIATQLAMLLNGPASAAGLDLAMGEFNLGESVEDFRVPDGGIHRPGPDRLWYPTAALVVEIVSPNDESWQKLPFYAAHGVDEVLIVDPADRSVHWLALAGGGAGGGAAGDTPERGAPEYRETERSALIARGPADLAAQIDWP